MPERPRVQPSRSAETSGSRTALTAPSPASIHGETSSSARFACGRRRSTWRWDSAPCGWSGKRAPEAPLAPARCEPRTHGGGDRVEIGAQAVVAPDLDHDPVRGRGRDAERVSLALDDEYRH